MFETNKVNEGNDDTKEGKGKEKIRNYINQPYSPIFLAPITPITVLCWGIFPAINQSRELLIISKAFIPPIVTAVSIINYFIIVPRVMFFGKGNLVFLSNDFSTKNLR